MLTDLEFIILDQVDSTNEYAKRSDFPHANSLHAIIAREQTKGKGRFGKKWISEKNSSILMSLVFKENNKIIPHQYTQILALASCLFLKELHLDCEIKWPNDLFCQGKKIGGILLEKKEDFWILGVGININQEKKTLTLLDQAATSYKLERGHGLLVEEASKVLAKLFLGHYNQLISHGFESQSHLINEQFLICQDAIWSEGDSSLKGKVLGIDQNGYLIFEADSKKQLIQSGSLKLI